MAGMMLMVPMTVLLSGVLSGEARADEAQCPWYGAESVTVMATGRSVTVNGQIYSVQGQYGRGTFMQHLHNCNAQSAAYQFDRWRTMRSWTIGTGAGGCLLLGWPWLATPFTAVAASRAKKGMVLALAASEPPGAAE
jgi:hypothetical protein